MNIPTPSNAELAVMKLLWKKDSVTARQIQEELYPDANKSQHGTVQKLLSRIEKKGFINCDRTHAVYFFSAKISRDQYYSRELESLANKLTGGSLAPLITCFLESNKISQEDIQELQNILENYKADGGEK